MTKIHHELRSKESSDLPKDCKKVLKKLHRSNFKKEMEQIALKSFDNDEAENELKAKGGVVRNREVRAKLMHGYDCRCCAPYYDALNLSPGERKQRVDQVSRHRAIEPVPTTPEHYWDVHFPTSDDQRKMGLQVESNSPLFRKMTTRKIRSSKRRII